MTNFRSVWSQAHFALKACLDKGIGEFVVCAGARNGTLVEILEKQPHLKIYNFFEERSAAFFAMGRIRATGRPVAVVTTSGTAVAETLPAVIESSYQGLPLVILSADRPQRYRGSGSPQSINQLGFFSTHVAGTWDLEESSAVPPEWSNWNYAQPFHFNVSFEEPPAQLIVPEEFAELPAVKPAPKINLKNWELPEIPILDSPLVIVGPLAPEDRELVRAFLKESKAPVLAETLSGVSELGQSLVPEELFRSGVCKSVVRLGSVPTLRFWRDLEAEFINVPVVNVVAPRAPWSGLSRPSTLVAGYSYLKEVWAQAKNVVSLPNLAMAKTKAGSELDLIQKFVPTLQNQNLYLGNSLTIRNFDRVSPGLKFKDVFGNRGVNGIDGQISTYLGWVADLKTESWCVIGDLTALYDLPSLWVTPQLGPGKRRIVIVNNRGGMIFKKFSQSAKFLNRHEIGFADWARMWSWNYVRWTEIPDDMSNLPENLVIELVPHE